MVSAEAIELANRLEQVISEQDLRTMRVLRIFRAFWKHWEWLCGSIWIYKFYNHHPFSKDTLFFLQIQREKNIGTARMMLDEHMIKPTFKEICFRCAFWLSQQCDFLGPRYHIGSWNIVEWCAGSMMLILISWIICGNLRKTGQDLQISQLESLQ